MNCSHCGEKTDPGKTCSRCGATLPLQKEEEVKVEYKEFRISELLDIRMVKQDDAGGHGKRSEREGKSGRKQADELRAVGREAKRFKTSPLLIIAVIILILTAIAGLYLGGFFNGF